MEKIICDVLVIGGGAAGCRAAYEAKKQNMHHEVILAVSGSKYGSGSTNMIASEALGINAPYGLASDNDNPDIYYEDMISTGGGLSSPRLCRIIAEEAGQRVGELIQLGLQFYGTDEIPHQQKLSGCTKARSLTCGGETGREIVRALLAAGEQLGVKVLEHIVFYQLIQDSSDRVIGALGMISGREVEVSASAVVLATGGCGSIFSSNVTPLTQQADGWAMAYDAGCSFVNMEFFQIGPAVAFGPVKFIIHSHMWRFHPKITNCQGREFLTDYCANGVSAEEVLALKSMSYPFSVRTDAKYVDIAIFKEIMAGRGINGGVNFDVTQVPLAEILSKAPITYNFLLKNGVDISKEIFAIKMAVQNFNGGVVIDENGYTGVEGLYAAGEATGGVHGSDRPGGNNLTDTQVFGYRAGRAAGISAAEYSPGKSVSVAANKFHLTDWDETLMNQAAQLFFREMTVVRTDGGLKRVLDFIDEHLQANLPMPLRNRLIVGKMFAQAQLRRTESRGTHYREDFPETDPAWENTIILNKYRR